MSAQEEKTPLFFETDVNSKTKDCKNNCLQYSKIIVPGVLIGTAVSGIWSFFVRLDSISVYPNNLNINGVKWFNGIACFPITRPIDYSYCNGVAESMSMDSDSNPEWDCSLNTDFENSNIIATFPGLLRSVYSFVITVAICSYFTIIHDIGLLRKIKNNTFNEIRFWPSMQFINLPLLIKYPLQLFSFIFESFPCFIILLLILCIVPIMFVLVVLFDLVYVFYMLLIYPFIQCKCNGKYCCSGMMEMSSSWIGISRTFAVFSANIFLLLGLTGISNRIDSKESLCQCSCNYLIHTGDIMAMSAVVGTLTVSNLLFLSSWFNEVIHGQYYFYLIKYSLPIKFVHAVNPNDPTTDIMNVDIGQKLRLRINDNDIDHDQLNDYGHPSKDTDVAALMCRFLLIYFTIFYSLFFVGFGIWMGLHTVELRGYSNTVKLILTIVSWTAFVLVCVGSFVWCILLMKKAKQKK